MYPVKPDDVETPKLYIGQFGINAKESCMENHSSATRGILFLHNAEIGRANYKVRFDLICLH